MKLFALMAISPLVVLSSCLPSNPNTIIGARVQGDTLVAVVPACVEVIEEAQVLLYQPDLHEDPRVLWESNSEVDLGATAGDFREIHLDEHTFPEYGGSYGDIFAVSETFDGESSWVEITISPRNSTTFGYVGLYDLDGMQSDRSGGYYDGSEGPMPPEQLGMSETQLCSE